MATSSQDLERAGTALLEKNGFRANGSSFSDPCSEEVGYTTLDPGVLASLRSVPGGGGAVRRCRLGRWPQGSAADAGDDSDNNQTLIERALEGL